MVRFRLEDSLVEGVQDTLVVDLEVLDAELDVLLRFNGQSVHL